MKEEETRAGGAGEGPEVIPELKRLGHQLGEVLSAAWNSDERRRAQAELKAGAKAFAEEVERAARRARGTDVGDVAGRARRATADGLRRMSEELEGLARRFTPAEGPPPGDEHAAEE